MLIYNFNNWWEWENPQKVTFDPINKHIIINSGETSIDVQIDMYSAWKEWVLQTNNAQWDAAFRTFGGDQTGENQFAPRYFFLINGWKILANNLECVVQTNLYSDDGESPFIINNAAITNRASDVPVVQSEVERRLEYGDRIYFNANSSYVGTTYPNGTIAQPINNIPDAIALATLYNITNFYVLSNVDILDTGNVFEDYSIIADREDLKITIADGNYLNRMNWVGFEIDGYFGGGTNKFVDCIITNALDVSGQMKNCQINGNMRIWDSLVASLCYSGVAGSNTPNWDMNSGRTTSLSIRSYSGGVKLLNCNTPESKTTVELIAGQIKLDPTCTDGYIDLRGVGYLTNDSSGSTVVTTGFIDSFEIYIEETRITDERLAYGDKIYYDETSSYTGITYPVGTIAQPVNNPIDAITIAQQYGINIFSVLSNINLSGITGEFFQNYTIIGARENLSVDLNYNDPLHNYFNNMLWDNFKMTGLLSGGTNTIENCEITYLETFKGVIKNSKLVGDIIVHGDTDMLNCYSGDELSTQSREIPNIYLNGDDLGVTLDFRNYSGDLKFSQIENENDYVVVDVNSGKIVLTSGCTNGYIEIRGVGELIDNSGSGLTINSTGFVNSFDIFLGEINSEIQSSAFENGVWIDISGITGTTYPIGTQLTPVNNLEDAVIIANERGFSNLFFNSDYNFESTVNISNFDLIGKGTLETIFTFEEGCILANCLVSNTKLSGLSFGITTINDSYLVNYGSSGIIASNYDVNIYNSIFEGDVIIPSNYTGTLSVIDSKSLGTSVSGRNEIYLNDSGCELLLRGHMGTVHINENNNPNTYVSIDMISGRVTLDPSITEGKFNLRGVGTLNNLAGSNIDLDTESFINQSNISKAVWDENIGDHLIEGTAGVVIGNLQFNGKVHLDPTASNTGTTFPVGTESVPVNNLTDAKTIAQNNGFSTLNIISTLNVLSGETISFLTLISNNHSRVNVEQGASTMYTNFQDIDLSGTLNGYSIITSGTINSSGLNEFYGIMEETIFNGSLKLSSDNTKDAVIIDVHSGSIDGPSIIDLNGDGAKLSLRGITGAYLFKNKTGSTKPAFIDIYSGRVGFDSTITAGDFTVRGIGNIYLDESTNTTFDLEGLMSQPTVASAVWDESLVNHTIDGTTGRALSLQQFGGKVWLDPTSPYSGTTFPIGTLGAPVNNGADAVAISERENIDTYHLVGILTSTQNITSKTIIGDSYLDDGLIFNNTIYHNVTFKSVLLSGTATFSNCEFINCAFSDIHGLVGTLNDCIFLDNTPITLASGQTIFNNCRSGVAGNNSPTFDCGIGNVDLSIRAYSGGIKFLNYDDPTDIATVEFVAGRLNLTNTCTDGFISARGVYSIGGLADVGSNFTLDTDARAATVNSVWDENITNHLTPNSTGDALYNVSAGADPNIIANTVWNTQLSAYTADGSAGNSLSEVVLVTSGLTYMTEMKADIKRILGLTQENFRITDHVYTGDNLDSATIKIFNNSSDCDNDVNPLETYYMVALYDSSGKLIDYKVTRN